MAAAPASRGSSADSITASSATIAMRQNAIAKAVRALAVSTEELGDRAARAQRQCARDDA